MWQDIRFALRGWRRAPGFALATTATLALGIGANAAVFSVVSGVLLKPLPFADPDRVVQLSVSSPGDPRLPPAYVTFADFESWRREASTIADVSTYSPFSQNLQEVAEPEQVATVRADAAFFRTLGARALVGRTFADGDPANVVVASFAFWQSRLNSDASAPGRTIVLDGQPFTLVGVMPRGFEFPYRAVRTDLWTLWQPRPVSPAARLDAAVGRLKPGARPDQAMAELGLLAARLAPGRRANVVPVADTIGTPVRRSLFVLLGAVGFVLLVACANIVNLLLARTAARRREVAVRCALGAGVPRLVRQFLTEGLLLALAGGLLGLLVAFVSLRLLLNLAATQLPRAWDIAFDWRVLLFLTAVCLTTGVVLGLAPALGAARVDVQGDLKSGERGATPRSRLRDALVIAEIALAFVLLVGAGLLVRTLINLRATSAGFDANGVLTLHIAVGDAAEARAIDERVGALPGVRAAGFISLLPLQNSNWFGRVSIAGVGVEGSAEFRYVTPGYFEAMGIPLRRGRFLGDQDGPAAPKALLANEAFVRQFLPEDPAPVGREIAGRGVIVGVVADVHQAALNRPPVPEVYYPMAQNFAQLRSVGSALVVRADAAPESIIPAIRAAIRDVNPTRAAFRVASMTEVVTDSIGRQRISAWLLGLFSAIGTALAAAGVFGVMSYLVTLRTREFGVRMALGASGGRLLRGVLRRGAALIALGLGIGWLGAVALTRVLETSLHGVRATDPWTFAAVALLLAALALIACLRPARRAARVDPAAALRAE